MKKPVLIFLLLLLVACQQVATPVSRIRQPVDTVGFVTRAWQMDSLVLRIERHYGHVLDSLRGKAGIDESTIGRVAISPHDDYAYAGPLYPLALQPVRAGTVLLFGVAHKAKQLGLEGKIIFDGFSSWKTPSGEVRISELRKEILSRLPQDSYVVSDSMHSMEHSLEALVPFLQRYNPEVEIIPVLVPYMDFERMQFLSLPLANAVADLVSERGWKWGSDFAIVISNDAVHYGDEEWGGRNYAPYGADSNGYLLAVRHEREIIDTYLAGPLAPSRLNKFTQYTVRENDFREYKWTWCGRYAVPFGLLTAYYLRQTLGGPPLEGIPAGYMTSIDHAALPVDDLGMGTTAPATIRHWVGYAAVVFK